MTPVVIFPGAYPGTMVLDVSHRQDDDPVNILSDLHTELAKLAQSENRYADVTIRAQSNLMSLLRLMRWDCVFNFQEVTGETETIRKVQYTWRRAVSPRFHNSGE